mmetsp:Transcript_47926/g.70958  ORF Transcript_47926/g.70958 Transcript_47926/m.70958 type:complete len:204 (-) Transcript_47926:2865-3476(-)
MTSTLKPVTSTLSFPSTTLQDGLQAFIGKGIIPLSFVLSVSALLDTASSTTVSPSSSWKKISTISATSRPAAFRSFCTWLTSSRARPAARMASSCVQSMATTTSPTALGVASQLVPSLEKASLERISVLVSMVMSSMVSTPDSMQAIASACDISLINLDTGFVFSPNFFPKMLRLGNKDIFTHCSSSSCGTTLKFQALSSDNI